MGQVLALPLARAVAVPDVRGEGRALQVTWHERDVAVVSVWRDGRCAASVRLGAEDVAALVGVLAEGLARR